MTHRLGLVSSCAALVAATPSFAWAQQLGGAPDLELPLVRLALGFVFCCLVAVVAALALKRHFRDGGANPPGFARSLLRPAPRKVRILETHKISQNADVCLFATTQHEYLVVVSASGATVIETSDAVPEAPAS